MRSSSEAMAFISLFISSKKGGIYDDDTYAASEAIFGLLRLCFSYPRQPDSIISKVGLVLGFSAHSVGCSSLNLFFVFLWSQREEPLRSLTDKNIMGNKKVCAAWGSAYYSFSYNMHVRLQSGRIETK